MESFQIIFQHLANADFYWQNGVNKCRNYGDYKALKNHICSRDFSRKNNRAPFLTLRILAEQFAKKIDGFCG